MADNQASKIQNHESSRSDVTLHRKCEEVESEHVEQQMANIGVNEAAHDHRVVLPFAQEEIRPKQKLEDDARYAVHAEQADANGQGHDGRCCYLSGFEHGLICSSLMTMPLHWHTIAHRLCYTAPV